MSRRRHPPYLRVVEHQHDEIAPAAMSGDDDYDVGAVVEAVVQNLMRDARTITASTIEVIGNLFVLHGVYRRAADAPVIRDAIMGAVAGVFRHRLVVGLQHEEDPDDAVQIEPPVGGLMQQFRQTLASEE